MRKLNLRWLAVATIVAGAALAGCSGGGSRTSAVPSTPALQSNKTVTTSVTVTIGGAGTQVAKRGTQSIPASNSKAIIIKYLGDSTPTNAPTNPFSPPSTAAVATIGSTPYMNINTGTGGNCTTVGSSLQCTITGLILPVGTMDLYVLDYDTAQSSSTITGNLIYGAVQPVTVSTSATIVNANTQSAPTFSLSGNNGVSGATVALSITSLAITPNAAALATASPFVVSTPITITAKDASGNSISGALTPVTVSLSDTTGALCLAYVSAATLSASPSATPTPCSVASSGSTPASITVSNTSDQFYVYYNNRPVSLATAAPFTLTVSNPAPSGTPSSLPITFTGAGFATAVSAGLPGAVLNYNGTVYVAEGTVGGTLLSPAAAIVPFTLTNGKLSASSSTLPSTVTTGYGNAASSTTSASTLSATPVGMTIGSDGNIWFVEENSTALGSVSGVYVGVYAISSSGASNGLIGTGKVAETVNIAGMLGLGNSSNKPFITGITSQGGYIWITDSDGDVVRVTPSSINGTFRNDTSGTGIVAIDANESSSTGGGAFSGGTGQGLVGTAASPLPGLTTSGTSSLVWLSATGGFDKVSPSSSATSASGGSFFSTTQTSNFNNNPTTPIGIGGIALDSTGTGNYWSTSSTVFIYSNLSSSSTITPAQTPVGGIAQETLDNDMFTWSSGALVDYTNLTGTISKSFGTAASGAGPGPTGTSLVGFSNYLVGAIPGGTSLYVIVP